MHSSREWDYLMTKVQTRHYMEKRDSVEAIYPMYTKVGDSSQVDYRDATSVGLGRYAMTGQGQRFNQDYYTPGTERVVTFKKYTLGIVVPEELDTDMPANNRVKKDEVKLFRRFNEDAADSFVWTCDTICTDFLTKGTSTAVDAQFNGLGRDGAALFATHTTARGAVSWSNLQTAQPLTQTALQEAITMLENQPDETGKPQGAVKNVTLVIGRYWSWRIDEILGTQGQVDTANNNVNALTARKGLKIKVVVNPNLSESFKGWLVLDDKNHSLYHFMKQKPTLKKGVDDYTGDIIMRSVFRFGIDHLSPRGAVFCAGL